MRLRHSRPLFAAALLAASAAPLAAAPPDTATLSARPGGPAEEPLPRGEIVSLGDGAHAYLPDTPTERLPLLVLLHGTGGSGRAMVTGMVPAADALGMALLAPTARGENWQAIDNFFDDYERPRSARGGARYPTPRFGDDVGRVDRALDALFARSAIDPARIWLFGFSHGGSYALALGLANPEIFSRIAVVAPGLLLARERSGLRQSYYVAHGRSDRSQRFAISETIIVPSLEARGHAVVFRPFDGGHTVPPTILQEALTFLVTDSAGEPDSQ